MNLGPYVSNIFTHVYTAYLRSSYNNMKVTYLIITVTSLAHHALAVGCTPGLRYCGSTLDSIDGKDSPIRLSGAYTYLKSASINQDYLGCYTLSASQALYSSGYGEVSDYSNWLFNCHGGPAGLVDVIQECPGSCNSGGTGSDDFCA